MKMKRNLHRNTALGFFNKLSHRKMLKKCLHTESALVKESSLEVLRDMERLGDVEQSFGART